MTLADPMLGCWVSTFEYIYAMCSQAALQTGPTLSNFTEQADLFSPQFTISSDVHVLPLDFRNT